MNRKKWAYNQRKDAFIVDKVYTFSVKTPQTTAMIDISSKIQEVVRESKVKDGLCTVFIPHTTAAVTINENADPDVVRDFLMEINKVIPFSDGYHHMEGNSAAHIKSSLMGFSETLIIKDSRLLLGTWQGIYLTEFLWNLRVRKVHVKIIEG